jgi:TatD DNase family protein
MTLIDSHCHLNHKGLVEQQDDVLVRARANGVAGFVNISTRRAEWQAILATAERNRDVWATIGIHPHEADNHSDVTTNDLVCAGGHAKVVGFGETGLDYYYDRSDRTVQQQLFRRHIAAARKLDVPVIIHTRDAEDDTVGILAETMAEGAFRAIIHCFTGTMIFARHVLDLGLSISISGIVTFKNARELQDVAAFVPADRLLLETDSPFLAPVPYRGKVCEPAFIRSTNAFVAQLRGTDPDLLAQQTSDNFFRLFTKARA